MVVGNGISTRDWWRCFLSFSLFLSHPPPRPPCHTVVVCWAWLGYIGGGAAQVYAANVPYYTVIGKSVWAVRLLSYGEDVVRGTNDAYYRGTMRTYKVHANSTRTDWGLEYSIISRPPSLQQTTHTGAQPHTHTHVLWLRLVIFFASSRSCR